MCMNNSKQRLLIVDILRVVAIIGMVIFHLAYDLSNFFGYDINYDQGWWDLYRKVGVAGLFIFLSGWSSVYSSRNWRGVLPLGIAALLVSAVSYPLFAQQWIRFGILHLLFVCKFLYNIFIHRCSNMVLGLLVLLIGWLTYLVSDVFLAHNLLVFLDLGRGDFQTVDHYPLLPWLAVFIVGVFWGRLKISGDEYLLANYGVVARGVRYLSGHSLMIYLLHQPFILLILWLVLDRK